MTYSLTHLLTYSIPEGIIRREDSLVKSLHPISDISASVTLDCDGNVRLERGSGATSLGESMPVDPAVAVMNALAQPLEYPPLSAGIVPGDRIAVALDEDVPGVPEIVRGIVQSLHRAGVDNDGISIVTRDVETGRLCRAELATLGQDGIAFVEHDPDDEREMCLVGMTKKHGPLVINRTIFDADVVLPVGVARSGDSGVYDSLFPRFSNTETIERFRTPASLSSDASHAVRVRETDEAGWLIGAPLVIEVVPGANETVAHVVAGEPHAVSQRVAQLLEDEWRRRSPGRASLVIATVTGRAATHSWENIGRALAAAERLVADEGAVAICSNLDQPPGESLGRLIGADDLADTERQLLRDRAADSWPAWQLARALQRGPVYFMSQLDSETVEDMGMAPVAGVEELVRLARRHESYILLDDAQHVMADVIGEEDET
ncbi:MAG TPA: lactate racemase domain-containing protein [Lacipirellulaceae bacterium]|nr:lactate racemase domain-containing protein [Lacipirellulaceae bacterium]